MSGTTRTTAETVPPEEIECRIAEYRRMGFECRAMPRGVYEPPYVLCPWPGCGYRIAAVDFHFEKMGDPGLHARAIADWWQGQGIIGRCPGCGKHVLFSIGRKQVVADPAAVGVTVLPDNWHQAAYIV